MTDAKNETHSGDLSVLLAFLPHTLKKKKHAPIKINKNNLI